MGSIYKTPQITSLFPIGQPQHTMTSVAQKCTEHNVLSSVLKRVSNLEGNLEKSKKRLKQALNVIKEKDNEIVRLKEQIRLLEDEQKNKQTEFAPQSDVVELSALTKTLQNRIAAIETFLKCDPYSAWYRSECIDNDQFCHCSSENFESPDLDLLIQQINDLNFEAGEVHVCQKTKQGAAFQGCQSIALVFYENGMQLEGHPFRDYSDIRTQFFIKDILDGFFPSELQCEYPRGVIFNVCDRRDDTYVADNGSDNLFKGNGCKLNVTCEGNGNNTNDCAGKKPKTRTNSTNCDLDCHKERDKSNMFMSNLPISAENVTAHIMQLNRDFFKRRLPESLSNRNFHCLSGTGAAGDGSYSMYRQSNSESVTLPNITIKDGQVCNKKVKNSQGCKHGSCMNTSRIKYLNPSARTTDSCIQLKIRSVNDKDLFILSLHTNDPVGKLRSYLPDDVKECNIMHYKNNYNRIYLTDNKITLKEYGILKNSVLVLCKPENME